MNSINNKGVFESQLSFSPEAMRQEYLEIYLFGNKNYYIMSQGIDYGYMVCYGLLLYLINKRWAKKLEEIPDQITRKIMQPWIHKFEIFSFVCLFAPIFDAVENYFILKMAIRSPTPFPDWWALTHSSFALLKWIILFGNIILYLLMRFKLYLTKKRTTTNSKGNERKEKSQKMIQGKEQSKGQEET